MKRSATMAARPPLDEEIMVLMQMTPRRPMALPSSDWRVKRLPALKAKKPKRRVRPPKTTRGTECDRTGRKSPSTSRRSRRGFIKMAPTSAAMPPTNAGGHRAG
jgi:hypothetical protein